MITVTRLWYVHTVKEVSLNLEIDNPLATFWGFFFEEFMLV